ncbi:MAG: hypothetical protein GPOALKHO_000056 [Sodalis sp.]|nr:MAG: hypothetical protein GPOALKHO_000056 [Sodalis sp.]
MPCRNGRWFWWRHPAVARGLAGIGNAGVCRASVLVNGGLGGRALCGNGGKRRARMTAPSSWWGGAALLLCIFKGASEVIRPFHVYRAMSR